MKIARLNLSNDPFSRVCFEFFSFIAAQIKPSYLDRLTCRFVSGYDSFPERSCKIGYKINQTAQRPTHNSLPIGNKGKRLIVYFGPYWRHIVHTIDQLIDWLIHRATFMITFTRSSSVDWLIDLFLRGLFSDCLRLQDYSGRRGMSDASDNIMCNPSIRQERVAVVGGGGYVGWNIVRRLVKNGHPVAIVDLGMMPEVKLFLESHGKAQPPITFFRVSFRLVSVISCLHGGDVQWVALWLNPMIRWSFDCLIDWLINLFTDWFDWLIDRLIDWYRNVEPRLSFFLDFLVAKISSINHIYMEKTTITCILKRSWISSGSNFFEFPTKISYADLELYFFRIKKYEKTKGHTPLISASFTCFVWRYCFAPGPRPSSAGTSEL